MKKFMKKLISVIFATLLVFACVAFTGCEDIKTLKVVVNVYDSDSSAVVEKTFEIELYRHLAPNTVDTVVSYVNEGYYDGTMFVYDESNGNKMILGEYKYENGEIVQNAIKPQIKGEFTYAGTQGSNLSNKKGAVGLLRTYFQSDSYTTNRSFNTGRATWYLPTSDLSTSMNDYYCVFGFINFENEDYLDVFNMINKNLTNTSYYETYKIYYTGDFDITKPNENYGLTFNSVKAVDYDESDVVNLFKAEGEQYVCYNARTIRVPMRDVGGVNTLCTQIVSVKVK